MVYVDDMYKLKMGEFRGMKMSHMVATTSEELIDMAKRIGINIKYIQKQGTLLEHFDICMSKRVLAVQNGAIEVACKDILKVKLQ